MSDRELDLIRQLDAANEAAYAAKKALATFQAVQQMAQLDAMTAEIARKPDAHAILEWLDEHISRSSDPRGDVLTLTNNYFVALDKQDGAA